VAGRIRAAAIINNDDVESSQPLELRAGGVIFDLDGTLADNMAVHAEAFAIFVGRPGLPALTMADRARLDGKRNRDIFPDLFGRALEEDFLRACIHEKESLYRDLSGGRLQPVPGLLPLLDALEAEGIPVAIATSAPAENVDHTLRELGLAQRLTRIVRSDRVARGKPFPDVFLAAAELVGRAPADCLAFEDAPAGLLAARAAGMTCVAITTGFEAAALAEAGAVPDLAVRDYDEFLAVAREKGLLRDRITPR
jgi:HAD superfamily hydrolase (TIGR01509 family)